MTKKPITKKQLEKLDAWATNAIQKLLDYRTKLGTFIESFDAGTLPPGEQPPNPPGIPPKP